MPLNALNSISYYGGSLEHPPTPEPFMDWWRCTNGNQHPWLSSRYGPVPFNLEDILSEGWGERATFGPYNPYTGDSEVNWLAHSELTADYQPPSPGMEDTWFNSMVQN
ncbi:hypothetical protein FRC06_007848, partial [Ceratobasidium sp. 370]